MSEVRFIVRESERDWSGTMHGSSADRAIAALSADPVTLAELEAACARFAKPSSNRRFLASLSPGLCDEPNDAGIIIIDLVARLVVVDSTYSSPGPTGEVSYHDGQSNTDTWLRYHLAEDWLVISDHGQWRALADERRRERNVHALCDAREGFYGRPLMEYIARETFAAFARRTAIDPTPSEDPSSPLSETDKEIPHDTLKEIHAAWLLTPREDLGGLCPREVALERRAHVSWDLQDQCERWSRLGKAPPGLDKSSLAFRYGGFGIHELVEYYGLVRELISSCWQPLVELSETHSAARRPETLTVGGFLTGEVPRLESVRGQWLESPDPDCHGRTRRSIIDRERSRLPEVMSRHEAIVDADCPCCQMMADMPGPMFWHLDGCNMDDDFAFDIYHRTREEWEEVRRQWEEQSKHFDAEWAERKRLGVTHSSSSAAGEDSVWSSSFSVGGDADVPLGVRLFGIGCKLAELIVDVRNNAVGNFATLQAQQFIDQLNRDFGNLREVLQKSEPSVAEALIAPVMDRFAECLAAVASVRPDLAAKCDSLASSLTKFLDPRPMEPNWDSDDADMPF